MNKLYAALAMLLLAGCSDGTTPAPIQHYPTTAPHWIMQPGSWAEYEQTVGSAVYNPVTKKIEGITGLTSVNTFRITNLAYQHNGQPAIARVYGAAGVTADTVPVGLNGALVQTSNGTWIGESANGGCLDITPGEPVATIVPLLGEELSIRSTVKQPNGPDFQFQTYYRTDAVGDEVKTTLIEQPDLPGMIVYHYTLDGEIKGIVFGAVMPDNTVPLVTIYTRLNNQ